MEPLEIHIPLSIKEDNPVKLKVEDNDSIKVKVEEGIVRHDDNVHIDTEENWNSQIALIGKKGHIYVYSDHDTIDDQPVPAIKIGDGSAYLIDIPFVDSSLYHIKDSTIHVTLEDKEFWNSKVRCYMDMNVNDSEELLVFTTD